MKKIMIIGAGQLGSRHLQALQSVSIPLDITVIDSSEESLQTAKQRFDAVASHGSHAICYLQTIPALGEVDLAIIATSSNVRRRVMDELLARNQVHYLILEKLLFAEENDYTHIAEKLLQSNTKAWVNCCMRMMPFYQSIQPSFENKKLTYHVTGSQFGLVTNAIHYIDHMVYLTGSTTFRVNTENLSPTPIKSKRLGFLELNGSLEISFNNGSVGQITCFDTGYLPVQIEIACANQRVIAKESEGLAWISSAEQDWSWKTVEARVPYQSELTCYLVDRILKVGQCDLPQLQDSIMIHLQLLRPIKEFLITHDVEFCGDFPFT